ncbi:MAG TPA: hypothetical protein PK224_12730 [Nitrospira sp.]|nr:hypothetical protein [Nitrospira sp.]
MAAKKRIAKMHGEKPTQLARALYIPQKMSHRSLSASVPTDVLASTAPRVPLPSVLCCPAHLVRRDEFPVVHESPRQISQRSIRVTTSSVTTGEATAPIGEIPSAEVFQQRVQDLLDDGHGTTHTPGGDIAASDAFYDFDEYLFLRNTDDPYVDPRVAGSTQVIPADPRMSRFTAAARQGIEFFVDFAVINSSVPYNQISQASIAALEQLLFSWWSSVCKVRAYNELMQYSPTAIRTKLFQQQTNLTPEQYYGSALYARLADLKLAEGKGYFDGNGDSSRLGDLVSADFWERLLTLVFKEHFAGIPTTDSGERGAEYSFDPYPANEVLFGLQVIHRQSWRSLGNGRGELVKSIPLGPRETQKVSVKVTTRTKLTRGSEEASSFETSSESSTSTKDTAEVVSEASEKMNKHAEAEVSGGYGPFVQAKVSGGISQDLASSSRQTKNRLNEVMQKTAGRMKRDTKVTVSTESEESYEVSRSSELVNPNDEVAVTYLYHRLQQRYWVSTRIAEVHSVVFVPERLPEPTEIDENWIARHADTIAGALLDQGFAGILNTIRKEPSTLTSTFSTAFQRAADTAISATGNFRNYTGQGTMPDFLASGQRFHERDMERRNAFNMDRARRQHQANALIAHICRHILHYMRAIWRAEDYDQRMQRYSRLRVPTRWYFIPRTPQSAGAPSATPLQVDGFYVADDSSARPLTEVIDPIGPIGYLFNCAIYRLRDDDRLANTHQALAYLRSHYVRFSVQCTPSVGAGVTVRQAVARAPQSFSSDYVLTYRQQRVKWLLPIPNRSEGDWFEASKLEDGSIEILGIRIWIDGTPADRAELKIAVRVTSELEDPQVRHTMLQYPLPLHSNEPGFFTASILATMADLLPPVATALAGTHDWAQLTEAQRTVVRAYYHEWIVLRDSGRLVPIETSNVLLDLEVGPSPILEPFKRLHRYIDVMREYEIMRKNHLENGRREALLQAGRLGDPEIERVSVVSSDPSLAKLVTVTDDTPGN